MTAIALLTAPGAVLARIAGLRGIPAWGTAAPLSASVISLSAIAAPMVGLRWGLVAVLATTTAGGLFALGVRRLAGPAAESDPAVLRLSCSAAVA
ncbi:MAG: hypothetical protein M3144_02820, partial [Actinomycetota bacterium]|nr:hypothetical protein [Actinomycetota bacterium]